MSRPQLLEPAGSGSLKDPGAEDGHGFLGKYPRFCLHALSASQFSFVPLSADLNTKLEPHDSL